MTDHVMKSGHASAAGHGEVIRAADKARPGVGVLRGVLEVRSADGQLKSRAAFESEVEHGPEYESSTEG